MYSYQNDKVDNLIRRDYSTSRDKIYQVLGERIKILNQILQEEKKIKDKEMEYNLTVGKISEREKIRKLLKQKEKIYKEAHEELDTYNDNSINLSRKIERFLKQNPESTNNREFMQETVKVSPSFIIYDHSNDANVYIEFFRQIERMLQCVERKNTDENWNSIDFNLEQNIKENRKFIEKIVEEIINPKIPQEGKYKIPHKCLFEAIRDNVQGVIDSRNRRNEAESIEEFGVPNYDSEFQIWNLKNNDSQCRANNAGFSSRATIAKYLSSDCELDNEYVNKIEKLFELEDSVLLYHSTPEDVNNIIKNGVKGTRNSGNSEYDLTGITVGNDSEIYPNQTLNFLSALTRIGFGQTTLCRYEIVYSIPKKSIKNPDEIFLRGEKAGETFLNPQYIVRLY